VCINVETMAITVFKVSVSVCFVSVGQLTHMSTEVVSERSVVIVEVEKAHCVALLSVK
jgi:hypothetical protein